MAIIGIGVDAVTIERLGAAKLSDHALSRLFHPEEVAQALQLDGLRRAEFLASRFAAKEAFAKALGCGFSKVVPCEVCVRGDALGKPSLHTEGKTAALIDTAHAVIHLSLTHEGPLAMAFVVIESVDPDCREVADGPL
jgi:holo-[acyl-carrier protein] synthase